MVVLKQAPTFETLLVRSAMVLLALGLVWAAVVLVAITVEAVTHGRVRLALALGCPRWCHRWLLGALAGVLAATVVGQAPATAQPSSGGSLEGLPLPDRPTGSASAEDAAVPSRHPRAPGVSGVVTVRSGQSLWEISRSRLPPDADHHHVAALTRSLYRLNRTAIGNDPDLIQPGQPLTVPRIARDTHSEES